MEPPATKSDPRIGDLQRQLDAGLLRVEDQMETLRERIWETETAQWRRERERFDRNSRLLEAGLYVSTAILIAVILIQGI